MAMIRRWGEAARRALRLAAENFLIDAQCYFDKRAPHLSEIRYHMAVAM